MFKFFKERTKEYNKFSSLKISLFRSSKVTKPPAKALSIGDSASHRLRLRLNKAVVRRLVAAKSCIHFQDHIHITFNMSVVWSRSTWEDT